MKQNDSETKPSSETAANPQACWLSAHLKWQSYLKWRYRRSLRTQLYGLNEELRWCKRELRRSKSIAQRATIQSHRAVIKQLARKLHLELAFLRGTPYSAAEKHSRMPLHFLRIPYVSSPAVTPTTEMLEAWRKGESAPFAPAPAPAPLPEVEEKPGLRRTTSFLQGD